MNKFLLTAAFALSLTGCIEVGPPNSNERDRRAYNSLEHVDRYNHDDGYYRDHHDRNDHDLNDYNPENGHDRWARHSN